MKKNGINVHPRSTPVEIKKDDKTGLLTLVLQNGKEHPELDCIIVATGRIPFVEKLDLDNAGISRSESGAILVDDYQNTNVKNIYALGDVCGKVELTPMAIAAGRRLADRLFGNFPNAKADYDCVPTVIFSHPPIGTVGLTEEEAVAKYGKDNLTIYKSSFVNLYYSPFKVAQGDKPLTHAKIICLKADERIVGLHIIGMGADEMLQGFAVAIKMGATKADFDSCIAIHPTASEEFVTMFPWGLSGGKPNSRI